MVGWCLCQVNMAALKPLSKRPVICAICVLSCSNWKNLEIYFERPHPHKNILTKGQKVLAFTSTKVRKRKVSTGDSFERGSEGTIPLKQKPEMETNLCASLPDHSITTVKTVETDLLSHSLLDKL